MARRKRPQIGWPTLINTFALPEFVTGSTWLNVFNACYGSISLLGNRYTNGPNNVPQITNREAIALIQGWREVAGMTKDGWPLWSQYAALAYGFDPDTDKLDATTEQADKLYDTDMGVELWTAIKDIAQRLDVERKSEPARVDLKGEWFDDDTLQREVTSALEADGYTGQGPITDFFKGVKDRTKDAITKVGKGITEPIIKTIQTQKLIAYAALILAIVYIVGNADKPKRRRR